MHRTLALSLTIALVQGAPATAATDSGGFSVEVIVDERPLAEYVARGTRYVEAVKSKEYTIRLRNPLGVRVAVALSVDGLNTIDARRTSAARATKWVLEPYECITISGWQTDGAHAHRFYFTSEDRSYAQWLGRPDDIGVITAVFFRERLREPVPITQSSDAPATEGATDTRSSKAGAPASSSAPQASARRPAEADDYAATGIGRETSHPVQRVHLDLEDRPTASLGIRYEYRPQLVRLGILPPTTTGDRLGRRERARGFDGEFCPVPER
jgi:hypothetical protein